MVELVAAAERRARADDREVADLAPRAELRVVADDQAGDERPGADARPGAHDGVLDDGTGAEPRARAEDSEAPARAPVSTTAPRPTYTGGTARRPAAPPPRVDEREVRSQRVSDLGRERALEDIAMRLQVGLRRPMSSQ